MIKRFVFYLILYCIALNGFGQTQSDSAFYSHPQSKWLTKKAGTWKVTMTMQPTIDATPLVVNNLVAERNMIGAFCLHEIMQPSKGTTMPLFKRMSDLDYNLNDARWDYMSIDIRVTAGIMFFTNMPDEKDSIVSYMLNTVHPSFGPKQMDRGKNLRVRNVIITVDGNHDIVKQYWKLTDGNEWLAVIYDYRRE